MGLDGWISLHRKILENPVVCKDADFFTVWIYLLLEATHKETDVMFNGERITLKPGQLLTGRKSIAKKFSISESKVQRILKTLVSEHQIEQQTGNKNRVITVVKWDDYQKSEHQSEQQVNTTFDGFCKVPTNKMPKSEHQNEHQNEQQKKSAKSVKSRVGEDIEYRSEHQNEQQIEQQVNNNRTTTEQQVNTNNNDNNDNNEINIKDISKDISMSNKKSDYKDVIELWNSLDGLGDIKPIRSINSGSHRMDWTKARLRQYGIDGFREAIEEIRHSSFLQGLHKGKPWVISYDWFVRPNNFPKVLEGNYRDKGKTTVKNNYDEEDDLTDFQRQTYALLGD